MDRFLTSAGTQNATGGSCLLKGGTYSRLTVNSVAFIRGRRLFEAPGLLEEMR